MNIAILLEEQARQRGEQVAIHHGKSRITYAELCEQSRKGANYFKHLGLTCGDTALVFVPMSIDLYIILLSLWREGVSAMFLDPSSGAKRIEDCCERVPPKCFIGIPKAHTLRITTPVIRDIPVKVSTGLSICCRRWENRKRFSSEHKPVVTTPDTPALITFTSGSTGKPKGTVRSHGFLLEQSKVLRNTLHLQSGMSDLATLPIFALINLASGVTTIIPSVSLKKPGKVSAKTVLKDIATLKPSTAVGSPPFFLRLIKHKSCHQLQCLHTLYTGGAPVFPRYLRELGGKLPDTNLVAVYGSTEAEPIAELHHNHISAEDMSKMASGEGLLTGRIIDQINCRIIPDSWGTPIVQMDRSQFGDFVLPRMTPGEVVVSGSHVLKSYLDGVGDKENKFKVDEEFWHRTGDLGYVDDFNRLWLLGRCSAKITDGKGTLFPFAVETAVMQNSAMKRVALCAINKKRILVVESSLGKEELKSQLEAVVRKFQIDHLIFQKIPMDKRHNAKVDYPALMKSLKFNG